MTHAFRRDISASERINGLGALRACKLEVGRSLEPPHAHSPTRSPLRRPAPTCTPFGLPAPTSLPASAARSGCGACAEAGAGSRASRLQLRVNRLPPSANQKTCYCPGAPPPTGELW